MKPRSAEWVAKAEGDFAVMEPGWERFREDLAYLSDLAVSFRYPGESADRDSALEAQNKCRAFRRVARQSLGLPA